MKRVTILGALTLLVFAIPAAAQGEAKERVRREVDRKQKMMREGKLIRTNVRVTVRLKNSARLRGVVKQGRMIERHDGLEFVPSDVSAEGAGIRLWYYDGTDSYIFLPFEQIKEHTIGERLTDEEVKQMGLELERKTREARERAKAKADSKPGEKPGEQPTGPGAPPTDQPPESESKVPPLSAEHEQILAEFPPEEGWSATKKRELELRKIRVHIYPNEKEQRFLDNYDTWTAAFDARRAIERAAEEKKSREGGKPATPPPAEPAPAPAPPGGVPSPDPAGNGAR